MMFLDEADVDMILSHFFTFATFHLENGRINNGCEKNMKKSFSFFYQKLYKNRNDNVMTSYIL